MTRLSVVCLHGLGGTPRSVSPIVAALDRAGYEVVAPLLPGHGATPSDLIGRTWNEWLLAATDALDGVASPRASHRGRVVVAGQSMGASLALELGATDDRVAGVAAINALVVPPDPDATEHLLHLIGRGRTMQAAGEPDLRDPDARDDAYTEIALSALVELGVGAAAVHSLLPSIRVPLFVATSDHDGVVDPSGGDVLASSVAGTVTRLRLPNSGHVAALDVDRELLCAGLLTWLAGLTDESAVPG